MQYSPGMSEVISAVRRRLGDIASPPKYSDDILYGYVVHAVASLKSSGIPGFFFSVRDGDFVDQADRPIELPDDMRNLVILEAALLFKLGQKSVSDSKSISVRRNDLSYTGTTSAREHRETIAMWQQERQRLIYNVVRKTITGGRVD